MDRKLFANCANASFYAYSSEVLKTDDEWIENVKNKCDWLDRNTIRKFGKFNDDTKVVQGFTGIEKNTDKFFIVFRGSDDKIDWMHDFNIWRKILRRYDKETDSKWRKPYSKVPETVMVHRGIFESYDTEVRDKRLLSDHFDYYLIHLMVKSESFEYKESVDLNEQVKEFFNKLKMTEETDETLLRPKIVVTGHSLGAALATICAQDIAHSLNSGFFKLNDEELNYNPEVTCLTYASPRIGNFEFEKWYTGLTDKGKYKENFPGVDFPYKKVLKLTVYRFAYNNDIFTRLPPCLTGWKHVGKKCYIGNFRIYPGLSGKDHSPINYKDFDYLNGNIYHRERFLGLFTLLLFYGSLIGYFIFLSIFRTIPFLIGIGSTIVIVYLISIILSVCISRYRIKKLRKKRIKDSK